MNQQELVMVPYPTSNHLQLGIFYSFCLFLERDWMTGTRKVSDDGTNKHADLKTVAGSVQKLTLFQQSKISPQTNLSL